MSWQSESGDAHLWLDTFWWGTERHGQCHWSGLISAALLCHFQGQLQKSCTVYASHSHFMRLVSDCLPLSTSEWRSVFRLYDFECNSGWWWRHQFQRICLVDDKVESQFLPNVIHKESTSRRRVKLLFPLNWPFQDWFEEWFGNLTCIYSAFAPDNPVFHQIWLSREFKDSDIEEEVREAFRVFDKEGNGFITTTDLAEVFA